MKKVLALALALVLVLSLAACGGLGKASKETVSLGKTVSTDIVDFTLKDAEFSYYASTLDESYAEPLEKSDKHAMKVSKGRVFVCMTFDIKNNDRSTLNIGDSFADWKVDFKLTYKGKDYPLKAFDLNDKDGRELALNDAGLSSDGGKTWKWNGSGSYGTSNIILGAGRTLTVRLPALAIVEPDSLKDSFEITVNIPNSSGKDEYYTYVVK